MTAVHAGATPGRAPASRSITLVEAPAARPPSPRSPTSRRAGDLVHHRLEDMAGGWFVGDFDPSALRCAGAEVAVKHVAAGSREPCHEHRVATEVTVVVEGVVRIGGREWRAGDVVVVPPYTPAAFEALTDAVLVVVKTPSVVGDKHPVPSQEG